MTERHQKPLAETMGDDVTIAGLDVRLMSPESVVHQFETDGVMAIKGVEVNGLWHLTREDIGVFTDKNMSLSGRYGSGTYVGWGDQTSSQIREIQRHSHMRHQVAFRGNALFVPKEEEWTFIETEAEEKYEKLDLGMRGLLKDLAKAKGENKLLQGMSFNAVFFYGSLGDLGGYGEGVIWHPGNHLHEVSREQVSASH